MIIWVVTYYYDIGFDSSFGCCGVFSTIELAKAYVEKEKEKEDNYMIYTYGEKTLDKGIVGML